MKHMTVFSFGRTQALPVAVQRLERYGAKIVSEPGKEVTHLLLPVPSFDGDGQVRGGGELEEILKLLPHDVTVVGGYLTNPLLAGYEKLDLLLDEQYLAENAHLTAECAMGLVRNLLPIQLRGASVLVIGWGRIGKCLGKLLQLAGAKVTVAARKQTDRAMLAALGYGAPSLEQMRTSLSDYRVIFNTVPAPVLSREQMQDCRTDCLKIDLASVSGMEGMDVITARGLPGKHLPESSGVLIAETVIRLTEKEGVL